MKLLDLFSGIGGFSLGLERAGFKTVAFCEIEPFPRRVLAKHWPEVPIYDDVRTLTADRLAADGITVDAICGGFPCQDLSSAGNQAGIDGERSGLWSEIARLVGELQPRIVVVENVSALLSGDDGRWFGRVLGDLAALGYDAEWHCIPASHVGAPHRRDRVWIVAYSGEIRCHAGRAGQPLQEAGLGREASLADAASERRNEARQHCERSAQWPACRGAILDNADGVGRPIVEPVACPPISRALARLLVGASQDAGRFWQSESDIRRVVDGIPNRVDRLAALGNAVVPQVVEMIGHAIMEREHAP